MSKETNLPDYSKSLNTSVEDTTPTKTSKTLEEYLANAPAVDREYAADMVEKVLLGQLLGDLRLKPAQLAALPILSRKLIEQAATLKEEPDQVDTLAMLSEAYQNNPASFDILVTKADAFFEIELERRKQLDDAMQEVLDADSEEFHTPDLTGGGALLDGFTPFMPEPDFPDPDGTPIDPDTLYSKATPSTSQKFSNLPDQEKLNNGFQQTDPQGTNSQSPPNNRLNEVSGVRGDGLHPAPVPTFIPHSSR